MAYDQMQFSDLGSPATVITLSPVIDLKWDEVPALTRDVNAQIQNKDVPYIGPERIRLELCLISVSNAEMLRLHYWMLNRTRLRLEDLAWAGGAGVPATDAPVHYYYGVISDISDHSTHKGNFDNWQLTMEVDEITPIVL